MRWEFATYHADHAGLEVLQHAPQAVDVLGEGVAGEAHAGVVGPLDDLLFRFEPVETRDRGEGLFPRHQHVGRHAGQDGRLHEIPLLLLLLSTRAAALRSRLPVPKDHLGAVLDRILGLRLRLVDPTWRRDGAHRGPFLRAVSHDQLFRLGLEHLRELVVDAGLDVDPVGGDARLARVPPLQRHQLITRLLQIRVVEDDVGTVPAQLHGHLLQAVGAELGDDLADARRARERHLLGERVGDHRLRQARRVVQARRQHVEDARREARLAGQMCQCQTRQRRLRARLHDHRAPGRKRRARLAQDHRDGEVPRHQRDRDPDRLLVHEYSPVWRGRDAHGPGDAFGFAGEPPGKAGAVVELAVGFGEGLARLVGEDLGEIVAGGDDEVVPGQEELGAFPGVHLAI